jgi:hypothetical protein
VNTEIDWLHEQIEEHARELRRLKKWRNTVGSGDFIRSTSIVGSVGTGGGGTGIVTTAPCWYLWQNQSGAIRQQGTVVVQNGNRTFGVTTTVDDPLTIGVLDEADVAVGQDAFVRHIGFQPVVLTQGAVAAGHYLRASTTAGRAEDAGTAPTAGTFGWALTASGGGASSVVAFLDTGLRHTASGGGVSGTANLYLDGLLFCSSNDFGLEEGSGAWISGTCAGGIGTWKVGAYASAASGGGMSGVSVALDGTDFCFAGGLDFHQGAGVWISGACAGGQADVTIGAYASAPPTSVSGVDWAANQQHLGFGNHADLREDSGVWISGTFAAGTANFKIGAYASPAPTSISGVDVLVKDGEVGFAQATDFHEGAGLWISGTFAAPEATVTIGAYPATPAPSSISGVDFDVNGADLGYGAGLDIEQDSGVWISGTMAGGRAQYKVGAYPPTAPPTSISGVDFDLNSGSLCWGHVLELDEGSGAWISGTCVAGKAIYKVGTYPAASPATSISGVDVLVKDSEVGFAKALDFREGSGVWISGTFSAPQAVVTLGAYPAAAPPTSISGVDFQLNAGNLCWGHVLDLDEGSGVWISGSCVGGAGKYKIGAYPATGGTGMSGVSFARDNYALGAGQGLDLHEGAGIWISGSVSGGEAEYCFGVTDGFTPGAATQWDGGVDPGNIKDALDQLAERQTNGKLLFEAYNMWPSTGTGALTDGCAWPARREYGTNGKNIFYMAFDPATDEAGEGSGDLEVWDGATITVTLHWTTVAAGGTTVCWSVSAGATANDGALDAAFGAAVAVTDTVLAAGDLHICTTGAITVAGAGAGNHLQIRIMRDVSEDNCASDADLIRVIVHFNRRDA